MIDKCTCKHKDQDEIHGAGMRAFTVGNKEARCTVCGAAKPLPEGYKPVDKKAKK